MDEILNPEGLADQFESPETEQKDKVIIKAIGVGGGGGNAVNYMFRSWCSTPTGRLSVRVPYRPK